MRIARAVFVTALAWSTSVESVHAQQPGIELSDGRIVSVGNVDPSAALLLLNGATTTLDALSQLDPDIVESIEILRGPTATELYGQRAAAGVILFITSDLGQAPGAQDAAMEPARALLLQRAAAAVLIFLDGEPSTLEEIQALDTGTIESVEIIKGAAARSFYGNGAEVGVIRVTTAASPTSR